MYLKTFLVIIFATILAHSAMAGEEETLAELDALWAEVSRTVAEGDFDGMAAAYHEDAVLVNSISGSSYPIAQAMEGWKPGIESTKKGELEASVEFRFSQRLHDDNTAHETGMFFYTAKPTEGEPSGGVINFEALLVKKDGGWKMIMEHQKSVATTEEWDALD